MVGGSQDSLPACCSSLPEEPPRPSLCPLQRENAEKRSMTMTRRHHPLESCSKFPRGTAHLGPPTQQMPPYDADFPQWSSALTGEVRVFFFLSFPFLFLPWKMKARFMTHVPCPPVKLKKKKNSHQPFSSVAASSSSAAPAPTKTVEREEKKQGRQRELPQTKIPAGPLYVFIIPFSFFSRRLRPTPRSHAFRDLVGKFSWVFSGNPSWQSSSALCRHFVFAEEGPGRDASAAGTHHVWVDHRAQFCNSILPGECCQATLPAP